MTDDKNKVVGTDPNHPANKVTPPPLPEVKTAPNSDEVLKDREAGQPAPGEPGSIYSQVISQEVSPQEGEPEAGLVSGINLPPPQEGTPVPADPYKPLVDQQAANDAVKNNATTEQDVEAERLNEEREQKRIEQKDLTDWQSKKDAAAKSNKKTS